LAFRSPTAFCKHIFSVSHVWILLEVLRKLIKNSKNISSRLQSVITKAHTLLGSP